MITSAIQSIAGLGKPRLIAEGDTLYTSTGATTFTATTAYEASSPALASIRAGMRIRSTYVPGGGDPNKTAYARVLSVDDASDTITVDAWYPVQPTNAQVFTVDGWIVDLPYCQEMTETFEPDYLIHSLYRGDEGTEIKARFRGWKYTCALDYGRFLQADVYLAMRPALQTATAKSLVLIPRADYPRFNYEVYYSEAVELSRYGVSPGYRKSVFVFRSVRNLPSWPLIAGYGMGYGEAYGTQL